MRELYELIPLAEGTDLIRQCWGGLPRFQYSEILHVKPGSCGEQEQTILLTAFFMTHGPEDANQCKPSKMAIQFSGVLHWEYDHHYQDVEARLDDIFQSPPCDYIALYVNGFYVVCRKVMVLSCVHDPFTESA